MKVSGQLQLRPL